MWNFFFFITTIYVKLWLYCAKIKLAVAAWSVGELAVTAKAGKTNLQAGKEKFRWSRPGKPQL